jgi:hypothetical protein
MKPGLVWAAAIGVVIWVTIAVINIACTQAQLKQAAQVTTLSAEACVAVATCLGRTDIASYCGLAEDVARTLVASQANGLNCPIDAGAQ